MDDVRTIIATSRADVWALIDAAISVASLDHGNELKDRRDGIVERLYSQCRNCDVVANNPLQIQSKAAAAATAETEGEHSGDEDAKSPQSVHGDDEDDDDEEHVVVEEVVEGADPYGGLFEDEQSKILQIKQQLEDPHQSEELLFDLLQSLADMDLTFKTLKETDIGRNVNRLRKHPSNEVRGLVKQLVRKWKDLVDEWVGSKHTEDAPILRSDADSPLLQNIPRNHQNGHHQVPEFAYSPNPHNGSSGSDRNNSEPEQKAKAAISRREAPSKPPQSLPASASAPPPNRAHKESSIDLDRLASARRRLHENYQEAQNAKKQRTIQVMDIHEIPKPKNGFIAKNKGGFQGRHHR